MNSALVIQSTLAFGQAFLVGRMNPKVLTIKKQMKNTSLKNGGLKMVLSWIVVFAVRLLPHRIPNVEGIMATVMPFSRRYGYFASFAYAALSIALFDLAVGKVGSWTVLTSMTYGVIAALSVRFFQNREGRRRDYVLFAVFGTIVYDVITGVLAGPLLFGQPIAQAFLGQIPFTLWHLAGNIVLSALLSPLLYSWLIKNPELETDVLWRRIALKAV